MIAESNPMKPTRNLWPFGIAAALVTFIAGTVCLIVLASSQREDLVNNDYYEQELRYQGRIDSLSRATRCSASAVYDAAGRRFVISLPAEHVNANLSGAIQLYRPSAAGLDQERPLTPDPAGRQAIDASRLQPGLWKVRVSWKANGRSYELDRAFTNLAPPVAGAGAR
jgi:hypothetical protein